MGNNQVAHLWVQKNDGGEVRPLKKNTGEGSNFYWDDETIFSYGRHFPIASFKRTEKGKTYVAFTRRGYSNTTAKHISYVRSALRGRDDLKVFELQTVTGEPRESEEKAFYDTEIEKNIGLARRAVKRGGWYLREVADLIEAAAAVSKFFGWKYKPVLPVDFEALKAKALKKEVEREEKEKIENAESLVWHEAQLERWAQRLELEKRPKGILPYVDGLKTMLRMKDDDTVETSRGAEVPRADGRKIWEFIKSMKEKGQTYQRGALHAFRVGDFTLDKIEADGTAVIGCHTISFEVMEKFAPNLY